MLDREAIDRVMVGVPRLERRPGVGLRVAAAVPTMCLRACRPRFLGRTRGNLTASACRAHFVSGPDTRLPGVFNRIDHIGVAVEDIETSIALYRDAFKMTVAHREIVEEQGVEAVLLDVGENHVELLAPLSEDTPVGRFLAKSGPGLHHVAYQVSDIDATLDSLRRPGCPLSTSSRVSAYEAPALLSCIRRAPKGVLTELVQPVEVH